MSVEDEEGLLGDDEVESERLDAARAALLHEASYLSDIAQHHKQKSTQFVASNYDALPSAGTALYSHSQLAAPIPAASSALPEFPSPLSSPMADRHQAAPEANARNSHDSHGLPVDGYAQPQRSAGGEVRPSSEIYRSVTDGNLEGQRRRMSAYESKTLGPRTGPLPASRQISAPTESAHPGHGRRPSSDDLDLPAPAAHTHAQGHFHPAALAADAEPYTSPMPSMSSPSMRRSSLPVHLRGRGAAGASDDSSLASSQDSEPTVRSRIHQRYQSHALVSSSHPAPPHPGAAAFAAAANPLSRSFPSASRRFAPSRPDPGAYYTLEEKFYTLMHAWLTQKNEMVAMDAFEQSVDVVKANTLRQHSAAAAAGVATAVHAHAASAASQQPAFPPSLRAAQSLPPQPPQAASSSAAAASQRAGMAMQRSQSDHEPARVQPRYARPAIHQPPPKQSAPAAAEPPPKQLSFADGPGAAAAAAAAALASGLTDEDYEEDRDVDADSDDEAPRPAAGGLASHYDDDDQLQDNDPPVDPEDADVFARFDRSQGSEGAAP